MALAASRQQHIDLLSKAKALPAGFHEDRRSVYWENRIPPKDYTKTTEFVLSERQEQLVHPKKLHSEYVGDRPSPIWKVSRATLSAPCSQRLRLLAKSKGLHENYTPSRQVCPPISQVVLNATPSNRTIQLAKHKTYDPLLIKPDSEWDWGEWPSDMKPAALNATPSQRVSELATPKSLPTDYQPCKKVQWVIPRSALSHIAGERLTKLALPKQIVGYQEDYDPNAWKVSRAALLARPSPCIENLAKPIPRKCRQKKTA